MVCGRDATGCPKYQYVIRRVLVGDARHHDLRVDQAGGDVLEEALAARKPLDVQPRRDACEGGVKEECEEECEEVRGEVRGEV